MIAELASLAATMVGAVVAGVFLGFFATKFVMYATIPFALNAVMARYLGGEIERLWLDVEASFAAFPQEVIFPMVTYIMHPPPGDALATVVWLTGTLVGYLLLFGGIAAGVYGAVHIPLLSLFL